MTTGMHYRKNSKTDVKLTELTLHKDSEGYYLSAKYLVEDKHSIRELDLPKIRLKVTPGHVAIQRLNDGPYCGHMEADIGFGYLPLAPTGRNNAYFTETVLEEKTHKMTLEEIEKKLGYKVKIVTRFDEKAHTVDTDTSWSSGLDF